MSANAFQTSVDIANRALQHVGARRITAFSDNTKNAKEVSFCYDKLRRAELRRNTWRFATRRCVLRSVGTALQNWSSTASYSIGAYTTFGSDANGQPVNYVSLANANVGNEPDTSPASWQVYLGNTTFQVTFPAYNAGTSYSQGLIVTGSDGRLFIYVSGTATTGNDPTATTGFWMEYFGPITATQFDSTIAYQMGEIVFYTTTNNIYFSNKNVNSNDPTSSNSGWVQLAGATLTSLYIPWPAGTGPSTEPETKNVYILPSGYLRRAPQDPAMGRTSFLGYPSNIPATDWVYEGNLLLSQDVGPIIFRFVADVIDVTMMDDLFCEGLGCRIGVEICETLTQSTSKINGIEAQYKLFMNEARNVNGIEEGSTEPPLDDYILTRL